MPEAQSFSLRPDRLFPADPGTRATARELQAGVADQHADIFAAIKAEDADAAEVGMHVHLKEVLGGIHKLTAEMPTIFA